MDGFIEGKNRSIASEALVLSVPNVPSGVRLDERRMNFPVSNQFDRGISDLSNSHCDTTSNVCQLPPHPPPPPPPMFLMFAVSKDSIIGTKVVFCINMQLSKFLPAKVSTFRLPRQTVVEPRCGQWSRPFKKLFVILEILLRKSECSKRLICPLFVAPHCLNLPYL